MCPLLVSFPKCPQHQRVILPKHGAKNSIWVSYISGRNQTAGILTCCLPKCMITGAETGSRVRAAPRHSCVGYKNPNDQLNPYHKHLPPCRILLWVAIIEQFILLNQQKCLYWLCCSWLTRLGDIEGLQKRLNTGKENEISGCFFFPCDMTLFKGNKKWFHGLILFE